MEVKLTKERIYLSNDLVKDAHLRKGSNLFLARLTDDKLKFCFVKAYADLTKKTFCAPVYRDGNEWYTVTIVPGMEYIRACYRAGNDDIVLNVVKRQIGENSFVYIMEKYEDIKS